MVFMGFGDFYEEFFLSTFASFKHRSSIYRWWAAAAATITVHKKRPSINSHPRGLKATTNIFRFLGTCPLAAKTNLPFFQQLTTFVYRGELQLSENRKNLICSQTEARNPLLLLIWIETLGSGEQGLNVNPPFSYATPIYNFLLFNSGAHAIRCFKISFRFLTILPVSLCLIYVIVQSEYALRISLFKFLPKHMWLEVRLCCCSSGFWIKAGMFGTLKFLLGHESESVTATTLSQSKILISS